MPLAQEVMGRPLSRRDPFTGGGLFTGTIAGSVSRKEYPGKFTQTLGNFTQLCAKLLEASGNLDERKMNEHVTQEHRVFEHRSFIVRSSRIPEASRHFAAKLRKVSQGFRKPSKTFLTASSICEVPLGAVKR